MGFDTALYDISYANLIMYGSVIPSFDTGKDEDKKGEDGEPALNPSDPEDAKKIKDYYRHRRKK